MLEINWTILIIDFIITVFFYMAIPVYLKYVLKKHFNKKQSLKIAIINSIGVYILFTIIHLVLLHDDQIVNMTATFTWGTVAYYTLKNNKDTTSQNNKNEDEQLKRLINNLEKEKIVSSNKENEPLPIAEHQTEIKQEIKKEEQANPQKQIKKYKNIIIALTVSLIILAVGIIILVCYTFNLKQTSEKEIKNNEYTIQTLRVDLKNIKESEKKYYNLYNETKKKSDFMDKYVVIVPTNTYVFHKYGCQYLDMSSGLIFNIQNAKGQGYIACKHCIK